jgi:predicted acylesterase/phospholipase RssA
MAKKKSTGKKAKSKAQRRSGGDGPMRVLAIDGGGMLGIATAVYLKRLESEIADGRLRKHFDLIVGTSTGSILAVAIAAGIPLDRIVDLYVKRGREIFPGGVGGWFDAAGRLFTQGLSRPKYNDAGLGEALRDELRKQGSSVRFGQLDPKVMITAYDTIERRSWVFKSWREVFADVEAWHLVKGSCSAPTYFPAHAVSMHVPAGPRDGSDREYRQLSLIDGGVWANNPAAVGVAEALRLRRDGDVSFDRTKITLASFGNVDSAQRAIPAKNAREWGPLEWVKEGDIIGVMMDGSQETASYIAESIVEAERSFRFSVKVRGAEDFRMDDASPDTLATLQELAESYLSLPSTTDRMRALADQLTA